MQHSREEVGYSSPQHPSTEQKVKAMALSPFAQLNGDEHDLIEASRNHKAIQNAGPPAKPLDFPTPTVYRAVKDSVKAFDHKKCRVVEVKVLRRRSEAPRAYLFHKKLNSTKYGGIRLYVVLRKREGKFDGGGVEETEWISTDEYVAIKVSKKSKIQQLDGDIRASEPWKEAACLQLIGDYHPNVAGSHDLLHCDENFYAVLPYCPGGDFAAFSRSSRHGKHVSDDLEPQAREWFLHLLNSLLHLQKKGVYHGDLSPEHVLIGSDQTLMITGFGRALRVPYSDGRNYGGVSDVSEGACRRLIHIRNSSRSEVPHRDPATASDSVDGFAADLWSVGVLLSMFVLGEAPFSSPRSSDAVYQQINKGNLDEVIRDRYEGHDVSRELSNLLQHMLWRDPKKRLTLAEVLRHPWITGEQRELPELIRSRSDASSNRTLPKEQSPKRSAEKSPKRSQLRSPTKGSQEGSPRKTWRHRFMMSLN